MRTRAIFTMTSNVTGLFDVWHRYYSQFFDASDIYVLDHDSRGDALSLLRQQQSFCNFNVVPVHHDYMYDSRWMARTVGYFQRLLLQSYKQVVFAGQDEIIMPLETSLGEYLDSFTAAAVGCHGHEVVHDVLGSLEPDLDFSKPVLQQRKFWYACRRYSKPLIGTQPIYWLPGFAEATNVVGRDPTLLLLHLHKVDFQLALVRHRFSAAQVWSWEDKYQGQPYYYNLLDDHDKLLQWLSADVDEPSQLAQCKLIPEKLKEVVV